MNNPILALRQSLDDFLRQQMTVSELCRCWRNNDVLLTQLPPQYQAVMENILLRLESGSMFTEESCSFSQRDLITELQTWLDKAHARLQVI
ncbi:hypothetical protein [Undibacterium oligocarboniphilum]|uniref:Uncharacterized protein n=1 Tax=Undibacterium oligocarboniphilum TaxID=666702 RepID=A0A850QI48_9BURK|nr:hypothetical protein [Undibacterium oligocarboniphilum]MBC3871312.1 hypothetical protein [Undibacterium oligocarboniphilum]NVO78809.1 hypothetical protein [Undibacterium oligocarboniphilum]